jgi:hypothetical protein
MLAQIPTVVRLNGKLYGIVLLKFIEVGILDTGTLDLLDSVRAAGAAYSTDHMDFMRFGVDLTGWRLTTSSTRGHCIR